MADKNQNQIQKNDLARVREIDFVNLFVGGIKKFMEIMGVTRMIPKTAGTVLKAYKAVGTLEDGNVPEGETIPLSKYKTEPVNFGEIVLKKWRKQTTAEAIVERGYDQAVDATTTQMLKDVVATIRNALFTFLATGTATAVGATFQAALAQAWGQLQVKFENDSIESVYFMNPLDVADYCSTTSYDSKAFSSFVKYLNEQDVALTVPEAGDEFELGSATVTFVGPVETGSDSNNSSLVVRIVYGDTSFLFTGDAEREEEQSILNSSATLSSTI